MKSDLAYCRAAHLRDGFISPVPFFSGEDVARHHLIMENAETSIGNLHYRAKVHNILRSPFELAASDSLVS